MVKDIFINFLPLIVLAAGLIILSIALGVMNKVDELEPETVLSIAATILLLTMVGSKVARSYQNTYYSEKTNKEANSYYTEIETLIQNGYTVYINGSVVDFNKVVISDYPADKIHINDELKEVYIGSSN